MSTRDEFEQWAKENTDLGDYLKRRSSPSGEQFYIDEAVHYAYLAWAARQQEIDALKAEIARMKSKDHIADASKMIFPPDQCEHKLNMVPSGNQDALDAKRWRYVSRFMRLGDVGDYLFSLGLVVDSEAMEELVSVHAARLHNDRNSLEPGKYPAVTLNEAIDASMHTSGSSHE